MFKHFIFTLIIIHSCKTQFMTIIMNMNIVKMHGWKQCGSATVGWG